MADHSSFIFLRIYKQGDTWSGIDDETWIWIANVILLVRILSTASHKQHIKFVLLVHWKRSYWLFDTNIVMNIDVF